MRRTLSWRLGAAALAGAIVATLSQVAGAQAAPSSPTDVRDSVRASLVAANTPAARQVLGGLDALERALPGYKTPAGLSGQALADHLRSTFAAAKAARASDGERLAGYFWCVGNPTWFHLRSDQGGGYMRPVSGGYLNATGTASQGESKFLICNHTDWNPLHWVFFSNGTQGYMQPDSTGRLNANHTGTFTLTQLFEWGTASGAYYLWSYIRSAFVAASLNVASRPVWATSPNYLGWERWQFHT